MVAIPEKHSRIIEEEVAHLFARAENTRGLAIEDISPRVALAVEKYILKLSPGADRSEVREFVQGIRADDLCLIIACERGNEDAWGDLVIGFDSTVKSAAYNFCKNREDAEDLASSIWAELHGLRVDKHGNKKTKLAYYSGRGSLGGWLRAVTNQLAIDQFRKMRRLVQTEDDREFEVLAQDSSEKTDFKAVVSVSDNPEEIYSAEEAQADLADALKTAIAGLEAEDRLILKLYYFDDLKLKDIGASLGFHEATASRKIVRVQKEIRKLVEQNLREKHGWDEIEVKRNVSDAAAKLGLNMEKLFNILLFLVLVQEFVFPAVLPLVW